jgi:hypothetical protein
VLLSIDEYRRLSGQRPDLIELLAQPDGVTDFDLEIPRWTELSRPADFS